jgi:hypothetical protein
MKTFSNASRAKLLSLFSVLLLTVFFPSCDSGKNEDSTNNAYKAGTVEVVSKSLDLDIKDTVPSGWTTFVFHNESPNTHFFVLEKYPEGKTLDSAKKYVIPVFDEAMDSIMAGNNKAGMAEFANLPPWFNDVKFVGGAGLTAPGTTTTTTFKLNPGYYVIECYVKMPNGKFHSAMGMITDMTVTDEDGGGTMPDATEEIEISSDSGIVFPGNLSKGEHVFAVRFKDQKAHENFVGHDVHLVKLNEDFDVKKLNDWMNWVNPEGLVSPAPEGMVFLGGTQEMPADNTAFFTANLTPGKYAFVSEVADPDKNNMLKTFTVED